MQARGQREGASDNAQDARARPGLAGTRPAPTSRRSTRERVTSTSTAAAAASRSRTPPRTAGPRAPTPWETFATSSRSACSAASGSPDHAATSTASTTTTSGAASTPGRSRCWRGSRRPRPTASPRSGWTGRAEGGWRRPAASSSCSGRGRRPTRRRRTSRPSPSPARSVDRCRGALAAAAAGRRQPAGQRLPAPSTARRRATPGARPAHPGTESNAELPGADGHQDRRSHDVQPRAPTTTRRCS